MSKVPFTNTGTTPIYSADGKLVPPGETRMIDAPLAPTAEATPEPDPVAEMVKNKVEDIVPHLANMELDALNRLRAAENEARNGKGRKTLIEAIELRIMEVEDAAKLAGGMRVEEFLASLAAGPLEAAMAALPELAAPALRELGEIEAAKGDEARAELLIAIDARQAELEGAGNGE